MYVKGPSNNPLLTLSNAASAGTRGGWQTGQLLKAMVVSVDQQGTPTLEINGRQVSAQGGLALRPGQMLQLEVVEAGTTPLLKVLNPPSNPAEAMSRGVRESLPQQQPLTQVLNSLQQLAETAKGDAGQQLRALSRQLMEQLPQLQQLHSGAAVKQAVEDSGHFLEAKLQQLLRGNNTNNPDQSQAQLGRDLKAGLLRLLQTVRSLQQQGSSPTETTTRGTPSPTTTATPAASTASQQAPATAQTANAATNPPPGSGSANSQNNPTGQLPGQTATTNPQGGPPQAANPQTPGQAAANTAPQTEQPGNPQSAQAAQNPNSNPQAATPNNPQGAAVAPRPDGAAQGGQQSQQANQAQVQQQTHNNNLQQTQTATHAAAQDAAKAGVHSSQQQLESGLARIQFNQLHSLQQSENQMKPSWLLEIPIRQAEGRVDTLQLEIQRDREGQGEEKRAIWSISLSFDLKELGAVRAGLTLVGEKQVGVNIWTARPATAELFQQHMEQLRNGMQEAGLYVSRVGVQQGIPDTPPRHKPFAENSLVDVKA